MNSSSPHKKLWLLFKTMFYISSFTFGGGFVIVTLMKRKFVDGYKWITEEEMLDMTAIAQASPGAIAVNASILVGKKVAGVRGIFVSVLGTILPPLIIISIISFFYEQFSTNPYVAALLTGMQAGVAAVIFEVVLNLGSHVVAQKNFLSILLMIISFLASAVFKVNVIFIILGCAIVGITLAIINRRKKV